MVPEENREVCEEAIFKEISAENLPQLKKNMGSPIEHLYEGLNRIIFSNHILLYTMVKLKNIKDKEKSYFKKLREKAEKSIYKNKTYKKCSLLVNTTEDRGQ